MAFALALELPAHVDPPAVVQPGPQEAAFGRVTGTIGRGTHRVVVLVDGEEAGTQRVRGLRFDLEVELPPRDVSLRVIAEDALGNSAAALVDPVFGLPGPPAGESPTPYEDPELAREIDALVEGFPGISAVYVESLATGAGAAWNARARFPAASSVKVAIAIEVLRVLESRPARLSDEARFLELMLAHSDNEAANALLRWLGGTDRAGAAQVNELLAALELGDSRLYGGFFVGGGRAPIPLTVESEPSFAGKYTTAWDLAQLHRFVHLAANGRGPLLEDIGGSFTPEDARYLLWILAHSVDRGKLDRYLDDDAIVPHKAGWITEARHDSGIVYLPEGPFVVSVMTWTTGEAGDPSDELAGRVAEAALKRFRAARADQEADEAA